ncbi:MAG: hypothetical protein OXC37_00200, partial [Bdellovibrionaceae bacterium]|nr:hypothetical protein [Pseudobdellovibrionaceae bacterium]
MDLLKIAQNINSSLVDHFFKKIKNHYKKLNGLSLTFWGISFKKGTDSLINSPALKLINKLLKSGAIIHVYDPCFVKEKVFKIFKNYKYPHIKNPIKKIFLKIFPIKDELVYLREKIFEGKCYFHAKALDSLDKGEALIIGSDCDEFKQIPLSKIKETVSFIFDSRSTYLIEDLNKNGLSFYKKGFEFFKADKHNENRLEDHRDDHHGLV